MVTLILTAIGAWAANPRAESQAPWATFHLVNGPPGYRMTLELRTLSKATYSISLESDTDVAEVARDQFFCRLIQANWLADRTGSFGIHVYGVRTKDGTGDPAVALTVISRPHKGREIVKFGQSYAVELKLKQDGETRPLPKAGPELGAEPYVEFDFSPVPCEDLQGNWSLRLKAFTDQAVFSDVVESSGPVKRDQFCLGFVESMLQAGFKAEVAEGSKIRVYGSSKGGKYYPATTGSVESPDLTKGELPKVKNPEKKG